MDNITQKQSKSNALISSKLQSDNSWFAKEFIKAFNELSERDKEIVSVRSGAGGKSPMTLLEVGERMHLTKERIRVIEKSIFSKKMEPFANEITKRVEEAAKGQTKLLHVDSPVLAKKIPGVQNYKEILAYILEKSASPRKVVNNLGLICELREADIQQLRTWARKEIKSKCSSDAQSTLTDATSICKVGLYKKIKNIADIDATVETITDMAIEMFNFSPDGLFLGSANSESSRVWELLRESKTPMSVKDLALILKKEAIAKGEKPKTTTYIRNICISNPSILNLGPSVFGLAEHIGIDSKLHAKIEKSLVALIKSTDTKAHHHEQAYEYLIDQGVIKHGMLESYRALAAVTQNSNKLVYLGHHLFTSKTDAEEAKPIPRSASADIEKILQDAGRTMTSKEILEKLREVRVLRSNFQINPWGNVAPCGRNWGLIGRDLPYSEPKAKQFAFDMEKKFKSSKPIPLEAAIEVFKEIFKWTKDFEPSGAYLTAILRSQGVVCRYAKGFIEKGYAKQNTQV